MCGQLGINHVFFAQDRPRERGLSSLAPVLQRDSEGQSVHVVWGSPAEQSSPAVLVTSYRPDPERWTDNFTRSKDMNTRQRTKYIHEGKYVAKVKVELIEDDQGWSPYLSQQDAYRLDDVRAALKRGDLAAATKTAKVFSLTPVAV